MSIIDITNDLERRKREEKAIKDLKMQNDIDLLKLEDEPNKIDSVMEFPLNVFPVEISNYILDMAKVIPCPIDYIAVPLLSIVGTLIGNNVRFRIKDEWTETARMWTCIVGEPGTTKTPAISKAMRPLYAMQSGFHEQYYNEKAEYEIQLEEFNKHKTSKSKKKNDHGKPTEPIYRQLFTTNSTIEALYSVIQYNPMGLLYYSDELSGWFRAMNQYKGKGSDRQNWLSIWSHNPLIVNRKISREPITSERPFVNIVGTIQPEVLYRLMDESDFGRTNDGMMERILFVYPHNPIDPLNLESSNKEHTEKFMKLMDDIFYRNQKKYLKEPHEIICTEKARELLVSYGNEMIAESKKPEFPDYLKSGWNKFKGYTGNLTLIIHMLKVAAGDCSEDMENIINTDSVYKAMLLTEYFKSHFKKIHRLLQADKNEEDILYVVDKLKKLGGIANIRDIYRGKWRGCKNANMAMKLAQKVVDEGYAEIIDIENQRGKKSLSIKLKEEFMKRG